MSVPIKHQIIEKDGKPLYVLVPYEQYVKSMRRIDAEQEATIPHKVVEACILGGKSPVRAWREHKGLLQRQIAGSLKISQAAFSQMEKPGAQLRPETIKKIARALKIKPEQLDF